MVCSQLVLFIPRADNLIEVQAAENAVLLATVCGSYWKFISAGTVFCFCVSKEFWHTGVTVYQYLHLFNKSIPHA